jgi:ABC-type phosphate transport system substrate-binding protein
LKPAKFSRAAGLSGLLLLTCSLGFFAATETLSVTSPAGASTTQGTLDGEGGAFLQPVISKVLQDDGSNLLPAYGSFVNVDIDRAIADFVGTGANQFDADFAVSERKLTAAETAKAQANGRTYAYVPIAATPVAVVTLVPNATYANGPLQSPGDFCNHMQLTLHLLDDIFGYNQVSPVHNWNNPIIPCPTVGTEPGTGYSVALPANLDPTLENYAMMSLLDSTTASEAYFKAGLVQAASSDGALTTNPAPSEYWPFSGGSIPGGDQPFLGKMIGINARSNAPSQNYQDWKLGSIFPVSSVWTGDPLGTPWNLPVAAIQNAEGAFVAPSSAAAAASEADATFASTSDPTTNNLVTFNSSPSDSSAYNNYLMEETYLVVPLNGLPAGKAIALAQLIRYLVGPSGQADISSFGAAPATAAMVTADLAIAQQVDAESAATSPSITSSTTTTTTTTPTTVPTAAGSTTTTSTIPPASTTNGSSSSGSGASGTSSGSTGLAFTGSNPLPLSLIGLSLAVIGEVARRKLRRRTRSRES